MEYEYEQLDMDKLSPMMRQYIAIKRHYEGILLFFRLGDFYELFFQDAHIASRILDLTLTKKKCGGDNEVPMCGVPYHSAPPHVKKLIDEGFRVAICEQHEMPSSIEGRKVISREVTRVITPGTYAEGNLMDESQNNYISSLYVKDNDLGICFSDISTGIIYATEIHSKYIVSDIINELDRFCPKELLYNKELTKYEAVSEYLNQLTHCAGEYVPEKKYDLGFARKLVSEQFSRFPRRLEGSPLCLKATGALIDYLKDTQKSGVKRLTTFRYYNDAQFLDIDLSARRNLELTSTIMTGEKKGSLLGVIDRTKTAMGKRLMRQIIEQPLLDINKIIRRQEAVGEFISKIMTRDKIRELLAAVYDIERLTTKAVYKTITPRELKALGDTLESLPHLKEYLSQFKSRLVDTLNARIDLFDKLKDALMRAIIDDPPNTQKEGGFIKGGYCVELDELREIMANGKEIIGKIEAKEKERTKIPKLKVGYNRVFGYYIEVTKSYKDKVPSDYIRKQTLSNCERFITPQLKEYEQKVLNASEKCASIEHTLLEDLKNMVIADMSKLGVAAEAIAMIDVLTSFALVSSQNNYCRPEIQNDGIIDIKDGRHPVVETALDFPFVPNDTYLDLDQDKMAVITGPNMAGKSTYMRQVALIVLLAQIGCYVPATSASICIVDKIFTRIGASDDLTSGRSTFMVEMSEVAKIITNCTARSLVILDEIGRGTSTFDGLSIAKAVAEYIITNESGAKTLFATHYHELTSLEDEFEGVKNYNIAVKKRGDDITFLRKIVRGGVDDSYGIAVAKLAGIPKSVLNRANEILKKLEKSSPSKNAKPKVIKKVEIKEVKVPSEVEKDLNDISVDALTPIEALNVLYELKKKVQNKKEELKS